MSGNPSRGRGGGRGGEGGGSRGGQRGGQGGGRGDRGGRGGYSDRGDRGGGRGGFSDRGGRGDRGDGGFRGGRGRGGAPVQGQSAQMAFRGPPPGRPGIFLDNQKPEDPDPKITAAEDKLVKETAGKMIDGFPGRSGYGTKGRKIILRTNYFAVTTAFEEGKPEVTLYRYDVEVRQELSKPKKRRLFDTLLTHPAFSGINWATDNSRTLVTTKKIDLEKLMGGQKSKKVTLPPEDANSQTQQGGSDGAPAPDFVRQARDRNTFEVRVTYQNSYGLREIIQYLQSSSAGAQYAARTDIVQLLNIIVTKAPNSANSVQNVGQNNFYPFGNHPGMEFYNLGNGLEALRGYYSSVRPAVNRLLLNVNVTSGAFFKPL